MALNPIGLVPHVIAELPSLQGGSMTVGDYLPRGHRSYARVMNPLHDDDGQPFADGAEPFGGMAGGKSAQWWIPADGV
ncbi:hypothetical protein [Cryobacterium sp. Y11]|jgi:hypothetical protein|uniref:hypothetical protein n=1 Tax=Cryobacterium sp. Y11 TaxID=2045016 RepID=UPI000CE38DE6|nr:hypothetical protein [Cryobacterium sp. Y11]